MNILTRAIKAITLSTTLMLITMSTHSRAQEASPEIHTQTIKQCITLMEQQQWQKTLNLINPLIQQNKKTGLKKYGAKFATAYYYKGLCLLKLAQNQNKTKPKQDKTKLLLSAINAFNKCFSINPPNDKSNTYRAKSALLKGNAQQSLKQFQAAIKSYKTFLLERNSALDPYNISDFNINLAICLSKTATTQKETQKSIRLIQRALLFKGKNQPSPRAIITALKTLTDITITAANTETTTNPYTNLIPETLQTIRKKTPTNLSLNHQHTSHITLLSNLILQTAKSNLPLASLHLTALIPNINQHAKNLGIPKEIIPLTPLPTNKLKPLTPDEQKKLNNATAIAIQARILTLSNTKKITEIRQAVNLLNTLLSHFPDTPHQAENLYNLTRLAAQSDTPTHTQTSINSATKFLSTYPKHTLTIPTTTILLNTLFHHKKYQQALTKAEAILASTDPATTTPELLDSASFIRAASHYYLGNFSTAAPLLNKHIATYPDTTHKTDTTYLTAAVQNQLLNWQTSIPLLQQFITNNSPENNNNQTPPSIYLPFAKYDIAYAKYSQRQLHSTILSLTPFTINIPFINTPQTNTQISPSAAILLGNAHLLLNQNNKATHHYQQAIHLATTNNNLEIRQEAYYLLINILGKPLWQGLSNKRFKETIPHFINFNNSPDALTSPYNTQILTAAITAIERATRSQPLLPAQLLSNNLFFINNKPNTPGIETALDTYLYYLRKNKTPTEEIIRILTENLQSSDSNYQNALITVAQIKTLEHTLRIPRTPISETKEQIKQLYQELISQFQTQDLDNFTIIKAAKHLVANNNPKDAILYYQAIINNKSAIYKTEAKLGLAIQQTKSNNPTQQQQAITQLNEIIQNPFTKPIARATAHYHIILNLNKKQLWQKLETNSIAYLKYPPKTKTHNKQVRQLLAKAYDNQIPNNPEKINSAIATHAVNYATSIFNLKYSAPAAHRTCQLLWIRNNPAKANINDGKSDRQLAYETAFKYTKNTQKYIASKNPEITPKIKTILQKIKDNAYINYPKDPQVKPFK